jgi:hypothetical protein
MPHDAPLPEAIASDLEPEHADDRAVSCRACGATITRAHARIAVGGAHEHSFINPAGFIFRIGCFAAAPGARAAGEESDHWTWFPGYFWQAVVCARCMQHIGWSYRNASASFVGLILDRVVEQGGAGNSPAAR